MQKNEKRHILPWILSGNGAVHICSLVMLAKLKFGIRIVVIFDSQHISEDSTGVEIMTRHLKNKKKQFLQLNFSWSPVETMTTFPGFIIIVIIIIPSDSADISSFSPSKAAPLVSPTLVHYKPPSPSSCGRLVLKMTYMISSFRVNFSWVPC